MNDIYNFIDGGKKCLEKTLREYTELLFPINRSITGDGFQKSLDILSELIPIKKENFITGDNVLDWTIPDEWNINDAYIITPSGEKIADFKKHNLHIVGYSEPIEAEISLEELKPHLHFHPDLFDAIPYVTSYYKRTWGFCITKKQYDSLPQGNYRVKIDSTLEKGKMTIGQCVIPGESDKEILLSSYLCHPSMANNELGGPIALAILYNILQNKGNNRHTFRFLLVPENIGAVAFLSRYGNLMLEKMIGGYVLNCIGHGEEFSYKKSRRGKTSADLAALNYLKYYTDKLNVVNFVPDGSDERQFCSPGYNLPIGLIMRKMFTKFPEYHSNLDDLSFLKIDTLIESIEVYYKVLMTLDYNFKPLAKVLFGTPQLSKSPIPLYPDMNYPPLNNDMNSPKKNTESFRVMMEILNCADGKNDLLEIAENKSFNLFDHIDLINDLLASNYIKDAVNE